MRKIRCTEEQILGILKESESGVPTAELCRKHGIREQTFYRRKAKCGGLEVSEAQRLRQLEGENRKLKHLVAEQALDIVGFKAVLSKSGKPTGQTRSRDVVPCCSRVFGTACLWAIESSAGYVSLSPARGARCRSQQSSARSLA